MNKLRITQPTASCAPVRQPPKLTSMSPLGLAAEEGSIHEIERKFLLKHPAYLIIAEAEAKGVLIESFSIEQRYLSDAGDWTLRCRRITRENGYTCYLTMKRRISDQKAVELETEVDCLFYDQMASLCGPTLHKTRTKIQHQGHVWEIDVFHNPELNGLEMAEIELKAEDETFAKPKWAGKDVTCRKRFKNTRLVQRIAAEPA